MTDKLTLGLQQLIDKLEAEKKALHPEPEKRRQSRLTRRAFTRTAPRGRNQYCRRKLWACASQPLPWHGTKKPDLADPRLAALMRIAIVKQKSRTTDVVVVKLRRRGAGKHATSQAAELGRELSRTLRVTRRLQVPPGEADKNAEHRSRSRRHDPSLITG